MWRARKCTMEGVSAKFKIEDKWFDHEDHKYKNQISNSLENSFDNSSLCILFSLYFS